MSLRFELTTSANVSLQIRASTARRNNRRRYRYELRLNRAGSTLDLEEDQFASVFRLKKSVFYDILNQLIPHLRVGTTQRALSPQTKFLAALRFFAQGSYEMSFGNDYDVSIAQPTVSVVIHEVADAINAVLCHEYIKLPSLTRMKQTAAFFQTKYRIPGVFGVVDGTHVGVVAPKDDPERPEFIYVNRKFFHSINVQVICDHTYRIINVNAKFPGSTHDSYIWRQSQVRQYLSQKMFDIGKKYWLLGDSGYPLEPWLMVPYKSPDTPGEELFNNFHAKCHSTVERCIDTLKGRWRCLKQERGLHFHPVTASKIINACVALHNICVRTDPSYPLDEQEFEDTDNRFNNGNDLLFLQGSAIRNSLIQYVL